MTSIAPLNAFERMVSSIEKDYVLRQLYFKGLQTCAHLYERGKYKYAVLELIKLLVLLEENNLLSSSDRNVSTLHSMIEGPAHEIEQQECDDAIKLLADTYTSCSYRNRKIINLDKHILIC